MNNGFGNNPNLSNNSGFDNNLSNNAAVFGLSNSLGGGNNLGNNFGNNMGNNNQSDEAKETTQVTIPKDVSEYELNLFGSFFHKYIRIFSHSIQFQFQLVCDVI